MLLRFWPQTPLLKWLALLRLNNTRKQHLQNGQHLFIGAACFAVNKQAKKILAHFPFPPILLTNTTKLIK